MKNNIKPFFFLSLFALAGLAIGYIFKIDVTLRPGVFTPLTQASNALTANDLSQKVIPDSGYSVNVTWGDIGKKLIADGAIDMAKYEKTYSDPSYKDLFTYLTDDKAEGLTVDKNTAYFWVNTLWALGLTQKSDVLGKGIMTSQYKDQIANFSSTAGWTLGSKNAVKLFNSKEIIKLTPDQEARIADITKNIYRPCCSNPASFPDCNHGMAILGLVELMVSQGASDEEIYKASLAFNSYWFPDTYVDLAYYFKTQKNMDWDKVDPKEALSAAYSSSVGYQGIKEQIGTIPGAKSGGASCGA